MKIETRDTAGKVNGYILPLWSALEHPELRPDQVYVTAIAPHTRKGPHLHMRRRGLFVCVAGAVAMRIRMRPGCISQSLKPGSGWTIVRPGQACALYNYGDTEALVINMPSPAWSAEDPDEHEVTGWEDPEGWNG